MGHLSGVMRLSGNPILIMSIVQIIAQVLHWKCVLRSVAIDVFECEFSR